MHIHSMTDLGTQAWTIEEAREGHLVTLVKSMAQWIELCGVITHHDEDNWPCGDWRWHRNMGTHFTVDL